MAQPFQVLLRFILLVLQLLLIGQHLPFAAPANAKMLTKWGCSPGGKRMKMNGFTLSPVFFAPGKHYVYHIARHCAFYKYHFTLYPAY